MVGAGIHVDDADAPVAPEENVVTDDNVAPAEVVIDKPVAPDESVASDRLVAPGTAGTPPVKRARGANDVRVGSKRKPPGQGSIVLGGKMALGSRVAMGLDVKEG